MFSVTTHHRVTNDGFLNSALQCECYWLKEVLFSWSGHTKELPIDMESVETKIAVV